MLQPINLFLAQGASGVDELAKQTAQLLNGKPVEAEAFARQIAFNCIPQIDVFLDNDYTKEEMKWCGKPRKFWATRTFE